ncbi:putative S-adenosylmethionine-dependent methyltransferase [Natrialba magadii ATCC 43099]|uniref:S-adenosylmethionine-dependent methyltransferase n=1 Tax=Natrialba magadii (strain ATCC 43099 / DSM 3394 / CCM 3739 / CIP 104546 / IAM 13178 / JCM 8861 / NBRC 102185 / NCIMB 2190 / MS3) TaxID=547559 RepID=D3SXM6_NATMM|nr:class I SAM-dependent methyltransferase [Natrialba magadii]ADD05975.1 putative S-adenosylmethionine-dependent methyltransferase [Natrialba magadii ATCC 43099]ELY30516.1 type 11 methyltransferase [Natrialba magadii ATCC 43099]
MSMGSDSDSDSDTDSGSGPGTGSGSDATSDSDTTSTFQSRSGLESESAQEFYGRWARLYDLIARRTPGIARLRRRAAAACRLERGDTVVEMGCGTGANLPYLREQVGPEGTVIGVDFTRPVLERARAMVADRGYENVHVVRGDATEPPFAAVADGAAGTETGDDKDADEADIDALLATFVVGMLDDPVGAVDDWCDLVGPGGHVVLANAARCDDNRWYSFLVNAVFRAIVVLSTPPTTKLRYESEPHLRLDERIDAAHTRLRENSRAVADETHVFGVVRLTGGELPTDTK